MAIYIIVVVVGAFIVWNVTLWGYTDRNKQPLEPELEAVFDPRCRPIVMEQVKPSERAVIMVHGFPSTPNTYAYAAERAYQAGYDVYVPLLPGFGTKPEDLEHTTFSQWYAYLAEFYETVRARHAFTAVIGTSMGASMTLRLGEDYSGTVQKPHALVTVAAPVFLNSIRDRSIKDWKMYLARTAALFYSSIKTGIHVGKEEENDGDEQWIGYTGQFVRSGLSFLYALKGIRKNLASITCPLMAIHDLHDRTISYKNLKIIEEHVNAKPFVSRTVEMDKDHNKHVLLMYRSVQKELMDEILQFMAEQAHDIPQ